MIAKMWLFAVPAALTLAACGVAAQQPAASALPAPPQRGHDAAGAEGLVLLGTAGGPLARADRAGIATLLTLGGKRYLVDAGEGLVHQLGKAGRQAPDVPVVFLTHLHDDHYAGLLGLASFAYTLRGAALDLVGPPGTAGLAEGVVAAMKPNAAIRMVENRLGKTPQQFLRARDAAPGLIFDDGNVRVTAVSNTHFAFPPGSSADGNLSYSLRFEGQGRTIVFTGDTGPSAAVVELARGADILVSEMASHADRESVPPPVQAHMDKEHLSPREVGLLAQAAQVRTLVLSHIGEVDASDIAQIRAVYSGQIILGADMMHVPLTAVAPKR